MIVKQGQLSDYFTGVAFKQLSLVETSPETSNQHEFNGSAALKAILGLGDRKAIGARYLWLGAEQESVTADGIVSWYDARKSHPTRTEYRLYYDTNAVTELMEEGDVFFLLLRKDGSAIVVIAQAGGTALSQLLWLFGLDSQPELAFDSIEFVGRRDPGVDFAAACILDELGVEPEEQDVAEIDRLIEPFGLKFPPTKVFSELARSSLPHVSPRDDPDEALIAWIEREEQLFRRLERRLVEERLQSGFVASEDVDVDGFLQFSLGVQNRRKSRMGHALENHLEAIFEAFKLKFDRGAETENGNRPDFLFPGRREYLDKQFPADRLVMLGAKSTLKDRWRQVLSEAQRIRRKHLFTLEPSISVNQTNEMIAKELQLVVPRGLSATFQQEQQSWLWTLADFVKAAQRLQASDRG